MLAAFFVVFVDIHCFLESLPATVALELLLRIAGCACCPRPCITPVLLLIGRCLLFVVVCDVVPDFAPLSPLSQIVPVFASMPVHSLLTAVVVLCADSPFVTGFSV